MPSDDCVENSLSEVRSHAEGRPPPESIVETVDRIDVKLSINVSRIEVNVRNFFHPFSFYCSSDLRW